MADSVLNLAWKQVDNDNNQGFIFSADLPYLIRAIDGILKKTLLNETGKKIIKDFSNIDPSKRIYKHEFSNLFEKLVGVTFDAAIDTVGFNIDEPMKTKKFKRDPFSDDSIGANLPDFKKEYKKYEKLNAVKEDEILYRDKVIENLEKNQVLLKKNETQLNELKIKNNSLEEEVLYRDDIILKKQNEIDSHLIKISNLESKINTLTKELNIFKKSSALTMNSDQERKNFNKELLSKVKDQQALINDLQKSLLEKKEIIVTKPIYITKPTLKLNSKNIEVLIPNLIELFKSPIFRVLFSIIFLTLFLKYGRFKWKENLIEKILVNNDIDYDYYHLDI